MTDRPFRRVALIGLGLIAGSMAHAIRQGGLADEVTGHARSEATRDTARRIGLVDRVFDTAAEAVEGADLVVLCVPVGAMAEVAREIAPHLVPGAVLNGAVHASFADEPGAGARWSDPTYHGRTAGLATAFLRATLLGDAAAARFLREGAPDLLHPHDVWETRSF